MKTIELANATGDWHTVIKALRASGEVVALTLDRLVCGLLLPTAEAHRLRAYYTPAEPRAAAGDTPPKLLGTQNYLELLRGNPTLVPIVEGQALEFVTMMNSSYISPEQLYQFKHPDTRQIFVYRARELQQVIGRTFVSVDFIPPRPKEFVEGKRSF